MKKTVLVVLSTIAVLLAVTATAERKIWMYSHDGNHLSMDVTMLDSISFEEPGSLSINPETKLLDSNGGRFTVSITANKSWTATVNDPSALFISKTSGTGSDQISVSAMSNVEPNSYSAILTITLSNGQYKQLIVTVEGKSTPTPTPTPEKCKASDYAQVTIGTQTWMAENYRCSKYDTESEAYNASWLTNNTIPSNYEAFTPLYYIDASDNSKWDNNSKTYFGVNLTDAQVAKLGYLYNWAAAVGVEDGYIYGTIPFTGNRQGICPNGWHVPSNAEWQTLYDYVYKAQSLTSNQVGKCLKTTSGWLSGNSSYKPGLDTYGFAALPAGYADGSSVYSVGTDTYFWTATTYEHGSGDAYSRYLGNGNDGLYSNDYGGGDYGRSVRCIENSIAPIIIDTLSVSPAATEVSRTGEQFTLKIESNANWSVSADSSIFTFNKISGSNNDEIVVTVANIEGIGTVEKSTTARRIYLRKDGCIIDGTPYLHYWINRNKTTTWPGVAMNLSSDEKWWYYDVEYEEESFGIIFNNGRSSGSHQTDDILGVTGNECFAVEGYDKYNRYYEAQKIECNNNLSLITVTTTNGVKAQCSVTRKEETLTVDPALKTLPPSGGRYKIGVTSNTDWTVSASEPWVTFDKIEGTLNDSIEVIVDKADKDAASATITFTTTNGKIATCTVSHEAEQISVSPTTQTIAFKGGEVWVSVMSNTDWIAISNKSWATPLESKGTGNAWVAITVEPNKSKADTATITYTTSFGKIATLIVYRQAYTGVGDDITDINGRSYPTVWINGQNWMAENLKCNRYDTESEAYKEGRTVVQTTSTPLMYTPYYTDASDKSKWSSSGYTDNITDAQAAKLGYLYNWAAAVGIADGEKYGTTPFTGNRQGICPNGWHVPTNDEWQKLQNYIEITQKKGSGTAGIYLKATSGWCNGNYNGYDTYGFTALPAGDSYGISIDNVGNRTSFWSATPRDIERLYDRELYCNNKELYNKSYVVNYIGQSVRCLRD